MIHVYDINSSMDTPSHTLEGHTNNVMAIGFQRDGKWLYSGSEDGCIKIWDLTSFVCKRTYNCVNGVNALTLHANQAELISGDNSGKLKIWDLEADCCTEEVSTSDLAIRSVTISVPKPELSLIIVGSHKGKVFIYSLEKGSTTCTLQTEFQAHDDYLLRCVISPDCSQLATTSADKTVKLWNTSTWECKQTLKNHQRWVWDAVFSADSLYLVTASSDQSAKLWDLRSGEVLKNYEGHNLAVTCVCLNDSVVPQMTAPVHTTMPQQQHIQDQN